MRLPAPQAPGESEIRRPKSSPGRARTKRGGKEPRNTRNTRKKSRAFPAFRVFRVFRGSPIASILRAIWEGRSEGNPKPRNPNRRGAGRFRISDLTRPRHNPHRPHLRLPRQFPPSWLTVRLPAAIKRTLSLERPGSGAFEVRRFKVQGSSSARSRSAFGPRISDFLRAFGFRISAFSPAPPGLSSGGGTW